MTGSLVILRHGESTWNQLNLFTGWKDPDLTENGIAEAKKAGRLPKGAGRSFRRAAKLSRRPTKARAACFSPGRHLMRGSLKLGRGGRGGRLAHNRKTGCERRAKL